MKKRVLTLALALVLAVAFAAPAFALQLGDSFTTAELNNLGLTPMYVQAGGLTVIGDVLQTNGHIERNITVEFLPGEMLYVDEDGNLYGLLPVLGAGGVIKYQVTFVSAYEDDMNLDEDQIDFGQYNVPWPFLELFLG